MSETAFRVEILPSALRQLRKVDRPIRIRILGSIDSLATAARPLGAVRLRGTNQPFWRLRVGSYRIVYLVEDDRLVVIVVRIGHRRDVYRRLT